MTRTLVALALVLTLAGCEREPARRVTPRTAIPAWLAPLPRRGVVIERGGLGATGPVVERVSVDFDTGALIAASEIDPDAKPASRTLAGAELAHVIELTEAAWKAPKPPSDHVHDYGENLVAVDGDQAMYVSVDGPLHASPALELMTALRTAAGWRTR